MDSDAPANRQPPSDPDVPTPIELVDPGEAFGRWIGPRRIKIAIFGVGGALMMVALFAALQ